MKTQDTKPAITVDTLDWFVRAYVECALWSSHDNADESGGEPMDANYGAKDIAPETLARMGEDCAQFQTDHAVDLSACGLSPERAGHDFWLTRNGHGAGFWGEVSADHPLCATFHRLNQVSKVWGSFDLYIGDDGQIYGS